METVLGGKIAILSNVQTRSSHTFSRAKTVRSCEELVTDTNPSWLRL